MPGFTTHHLFGAQVLEQLNNTSLKQTLEQNRRPFNLGLQGPDIFFFKLTAHLHRGCKNPGVYLHEHQIREFFGSCFEKLLNMPAGRAKEQCIAYVSGFLCHYTLDSICHPYIYWKTNSLLKKKRKNTFGIHSEIETSIDAGILKKYRNLKPLDFHTYEAVALTKEELNTISSFLSDAINRTYAKAPDAGSFRVSPFYVKRAITGLQKGCLLLKDRSGLKKKAVRSIECFLFRFPIISGMFVTNRPKNPGKFFNESHQEWTNPWDESMVSTDSVPEMFDRALVVCRRAFGFMEDMPQKGDFEKLLQSIGKYSYHGALLS